MNALSGSPALKVQVMCEGIRYTAALGNAAPHSMPNYYPYRFKEGEHDPTGRGIASIPYLINTADGTEIRILGNGELTKKLTVKASHFSKSATEKITAKGGTVELIPGPKKPVKNKMKPKKAKS